MDLEGMSITIGLFTRAAAGLRQNHFTLNPQNLQQHEDVEKPKSSLREQEREKEQGQAKSVNGTKETNSKCDTDRKTNHVNLSSKYTRV